MDNSYYEILEVSRGASKDELRKKKIELSRKYHPDKLPDEKKEWGTEMIKKINEAYDILSDDEKRRMYDQFGKDGLNGQMPNGFNPFPGFGGMPFPFAGNMFNQHFNQKRGEQVQIPPIRIQVDITLEDIFMGKEIKQVIQRSGPCTECDSTGYTDKKHHKCSACSGSGQQVEIKRMGHQQLFTQGNCSKCNGTGNLNELSKYCKKCNGKKVLEENYEIVHFMDKGLNKEGGFAIKGNGNYVSVNGKGKRGDIIIVLKILDHPLFKMNKYNLEMTMDLQLVEALCGFTKSIKFLDGNNLFIDISDPINNGDVKVLKEHGLPYAQSTYKCGDLYIKFNVILPTVLVEECKKNIYLALTGQQYNYTTIHNLPEDVQPVMLLNSDSLPESDNNYEEEDEGNGPQGGQHVQCAQQ